MPPEQIPWDRRDFRKHDRSASDHRFGFAGPNRWRDQPPPHAPPYHHHNAHHQQNRWYSDFRSGRPVPPGHGKQGGWHMQPDESGHGFVPFGSRYGDRNVEDDNFRPFASRGDGRYFRNSRENRGSFSQKDWRSPSWEPAPSASGPGRPNSEVNNQKSVENTQTSHNNDSKSNASPHPLPDSSVGQSQSQSLVKEKHEKNDTVADAPASSDQKSERENGLGSIDWKPLKWTRSGSLSSRGSGFSHSSSSKGMGVDSVETVAEVQQKSVTPVQSPAAVSVVSNAPAPSDETSSRKKPRLGWGEGLAKYEKKKVEPEDGAAKDGVVVGVINAETIKSPSVSLPDKSPGIASLSDCASPATPSSVACSSSPGIEEKESIKAANVDHDTTTLSCSPSIMPQTHYEGPTFNLENLELTSIANLSSLINELVQSNDPSSAETGYVRTTAMNKLLVWKVDILKALEVTESEIDKLETELKSMITEPRNCSTHPAASSLPPRDGNSKPCEEQATASSVTARPSSLQVVSSEDMILENMPAVLKDKHVASKDEEIDSPGSATSKLVEVLPSGEDAFPSQTAQCVENLDPNNSSNLERCLGTCPSKGHNTCITDDHNKLILTNCHNLATVGNGHCGVDHIYDSILASNKDCAEMAAEELNKLLAISTAPSATSLRRNSSVIKEKFLMRKQSLQFKEKLITLKFKVFQHFWKQGRVVSVKKLRGKSHKKFDQSRSGYKKNRSSSRSRVSYSVWCPRTVPAEEVIEFVNGLLAESPLRPCRDTLKMPALILDKDTKMSRFISSNGLVEDPCAAEKERSMINPWTAEEMEIFIDKLAIFGKDFVKIASFLEHKTIADCIEFYYKNHKLECFDRVRKKPDFAKKIKSQSTTYLVATGKRWNREANAASLEILGEASVIAANVNDGMETQQKCTSRIFFGASSSRKAPRGDDGPLQRSNSLDMYSNETVAADVLAGICGSLSSEAMSSCITSSVEPADGYQDWKCQRVNSCIKRPLTPDVIQNVDDECSDESCGEMDPTDWTDEEKSVLIQAVSSYGKDFVMISQCVRTRSREQCKIFFSKARKCLGLDQMQPGAGNVVSADVNGGGSDTEDACVVQTGSVICNDSSDLKMEEDLPLTDVTMGLECDIAETNPDSMATELVPKNPSTGDAQVDDKPVADTNIVSKEQEACNTAVEVKTLGLSSNTESVPVEEGDEVVRPNGFIGADNKALVEVSDGHSLEENEKRLLILPADNLGNKKVENVIANACEASVINCAASEMKSEGQLAGNVSHPFVDTHSSAKVQSGGPKESGAESCSAEKSCAISFWQNGHLTSMESSTLFSVPIKYQRHSSTNVLSNVVANGISEKHPRKTVSEGDRQQNYMGYSLSDPVESSHILRGYPVSVQTMKEINGDVNGKKHVLLQNVSKPVEKLQSDRQTDFSLQKCSVSRNQSEVVHTPFALQEQSCSSDVDKPSRNGDVKLFGKILISSQQKSNSCLQENGDDNRQHHKAGSQSLNLKFGGDQKVNLDSSQSKFDNNNFLGCDNIPLRSFGIWEGSRTETSFPPLSDSTLLLNKYPAAFINHPMPTVKLEQPSIHGVVRSSDHPLNGVSIFPSRELSSSNGLADYQVLRNRELQPFTIDMQQPQDMLFSEMQRRNGFDLVSGLQQQAGGVVGMNVIGRGGILVGGQSAGVSDPVTAIKMHYAKAQNISVQAGNVVREKDAWRSNGDVGR